MLNVCISDLIMAKFFDFNIGLSRFVIRDKNTFRHSASQNAQRTVKIRCHSSTALLAAPFYRRLLLQCAETFVFLAAEESCRGRSNCLGWKLTAAAG
jgi:hypothetical protein